MINNAIMSAAAEVDIGSVMNSSLTFPERISLGVQTMLLGMGIVFAVLIIIMGVLQLFRIFFYDLPNRNKKAQSEAPAAPAPAEEPVAISSAVESDDDEAVMAAISAAVAVYLDAPAASFRVVSFKRINKK